MLNKFSLPACLAFTLLGLSSAASAEEAPAIFNGKNLDGWIAEGRTERTVDGKMLPTWSVENGMLVCNDAGAMCFLRYDKEVSDFSFHVEFRMLKPKSNSGIGIRTGVYDATTKDRSRATRPSIYSYEIQLFDDSGTAANPKSSGSLYRYVAPRENAIKPPLEWNTLDVECVGPRIKVTMNGKLIHDVDQSTIPEIKGKPLKGYVCLQSHGGQTEFREVRLREIK